MAIYIEMVELKPQTIFLLLYYKWYKPCLHVQSSLMSRPTCILTYDKILSLLHRKCNSNPLAFHHLIILSLSLLAPLGSYLSEIKLSNSSSTF